MLCNHKPTVVVRGIEEKAYVGFCSFHAYLVQWIFEKLDINSVKWRPFYEILKEEYEQMRKTLE